MYRCRVHFYLMGWPEEDAGLIKAMPPLERFSHVFAESARPNAELAARAGVILADLRNTDAAKALTALTGARKEGTQLIVLVEAGQLGELSPFLPELQDIWTAPLPAETLKFRFLRWQESFRQSKDLWERGQFLDSVINGVPNLVWFKDKAGVHEKVNDSFCKTVNKTRAQVQGRRHAYIWDVEQDDPACVESERTVMETERTCVSEERIQTGGGPRLLTTYKSPLYDVDGSVMGTVGVAIDITQERAYEQELIHQRDALEAIFTSLDCGIICHTVDGSRVISVNRAALDILGYRSQEEMTENGFFLVAASVVDEDKETLRRLITGLKKAGDSASVEYRVRHPDGQVLHIMGSIKLVEENSQLYIRRFLLDCTAQKLREQQERVESERRQMELVQALSVDYSLVCVFDLVTGTGRSLRTGDCPAGQLRELFAGDLELESCMDRYIETCVYEEDQEALRRVCRRKYLEEKLSAGSTLYLNYRTMCMGEMRCFQMKAVRTGSWKGRHTVVLGFRNVDEETRQELEKKTMLEEALTQANQASRAKSVFLSNMSHDIRTPMNAIVGFTSLALTHLDQKEQVAGYLNKILTSGNHLVSLINDVLDMSRIESGKMHLAEEPCSLPDILASLRSIVQADVRAKQLDFSVDAADVRNEHIYCDKLRLNQVLLNLLSNAIKYTPAGGAVRMRVIETPGAPRGCASYEFRVKDNGIGMSREFVKRIFEPFERERNSTISGIQGTGLGMAITKNIVDMMHGSIQVRSEQGAGSEFTVRFAFRLPADPEEAAEVPCSGVLPASGKPRRHTGRILLAEDNELNQEIATAILTEAGFTVEVAANGRLAVDMLQASQPGYYQLILMDVQMPVMDGYTATRTIRALDDRRLASIPILAMTANAFEEDRRDALHAGMNGHIAKPIDIKKLLDTLDRIMN